MGIETECQIPCRRPCHCGRESLRLHPLYDSTYTHRQTRNHHRWPFWTSPTQRWTSPGCGSWWWWGGGLWNLHDGIPGVCRDNKTPFSSILRDSQRPNSRATQEKHVFDDFPRYNTFRNMVERRQTVNVLNPFSAYLIITSKYKSVFD